MRGDRGRVQGADRRSEIAVERARCKTTVAMSTARPHDVITATAAATTDPVIRPGCVADPKVARSKRRVGATTRAVNCQPLLPVAEAGGHGMQARH